MDYNTILFDASGKERVSQLRTLFDGKLTTGNNNLLFEKAGTGTHSTVNAKNNMSVTSGQWCVYNSRRPLIYSSGKSQVVEQTFDKFAPETGLVKRVGYFDSVKTTPFDTGLDGFWLETTDTSIRLVVKHADIETPRQNIDIKDWTGFKNASSISAENVDYWNGFSVIYWDYLWLGGANLRLFVMTPNGWYLAHQYIHAGLGIEDTMIKYPSKPLRYEIRSTTGEGEFRYICSQASTEGDISETGFGKVVRVQNITCATVGTTYPILGIRKKAGSSATPVKLEDFGIVTHSTNDRAIYTIQINPTLSSPGAWTDVPDSNVQRGVGNGTITVTAGGTELIAGTTITNVILPAGSLDTSYLSSIGETLTGTSDEIWLCLTPQTTSITSNATLSFKEY